MWHRVFSVVSCVRKLWNVAAVLRAGKKAHQAIVERESPDRVLELLQPRT